MRIICRKAIAEMRSFFPAGLERIDLPGVGHFVQRERPDVVAGYVRLFCE
jgi:pimeloyl-ACP methyl ester carboxylesterase